MNNRPIRWPFIGLYYRTVKVDMYVTFQWRARLFVSASKTLKLQ